MTVKANSTTEIPLKWVGPIKCDLGDGEESLKVPMATYETTLWPSTNRGAKVSRFTDGIQTACLSSTMTRSAILSAPDMTQAVGITTQITANLAALKFPVSESSRFAELISIHPEVVGRLIFLRLQFTTGDAAGHNMTTKATDAIIRHLLGHFPNLEYESISGNLCTDKKTSAINSLLGRGHHILASMTIKREACQKHLRTTPEAIVRLNNHKNLLGGTLAGSLRSANAHFANMLLATYLATGQDAANIVEGSQGITLAEIVDDALQISIKCPNIIVGTIGNGKHLPKVQDALKQLGCQEDRPTGMNSQRLARIIGATLLCGELSLLAAQTNPGELTRSHMVFER